MAGIPIAFVTDDVSLSAGVAKTVGQVSAPNNQRVKLKRLFVSFKGAVTTDTPVQVKLVRQTGTGTSTAMNPVKLDPTMPETLQSSGVKNCTIEPTSDDAVVRQFNVHPQDGIDQINQLTSELVIPGGYRLGFKMNAAQAQTVVVTAEGEE